MAVKMSIMVVVIVMVVVLLVMLVVVVVTTAATTTTTTTMMTTTTTTTLVVIMMTMTVMMMMMMIGMVVVILILYMFVFCWSCHNSTFSTVHFDGSPSTCSCERRQTLTLLSVVLRVVRSGKHGSGRVNLSITMILHITRVTHIKGSKERYLLGQNTACEFSG